MASTVLNSSRAIVMSLYIIRAFVKMREDLAANAASIRAAVWLVAVGRRR